MGVRTINGIIKIKFKDYLHKKGGNVDGLDKAVNRFSLGLFDAFFDGMGYCSMYNSSRDKVFWSILNKLKRSKDIGWIKERNLVVLKNLFFEFIEFCSTNDIKTILLEKYNSNTESLLEGYNDVNLVSERNKYIFDDKGENGDKFREYLLYIYQNLGIKNKNGIICFYNAMYDAYTICSEINNKNKKIENGEKSDAFGIAFDFLCNELNKYGFKLEDDKIKSLFGKYLHFIPEYRQKLSENLSASTQGSNKVKQTTKTDLGENLTEKWAIPGDASYTGDGLGPIEIISSDETGQLTARGDILPPDIGNFNVDQCSFGKEDEVVVKPKKNKKTTKFKGQKNQINIDFN